MPLNKQKGNMYPWVTHTWNPIKGTCPHQCNYCYVPSALRGKPWGKLRLDKKAPVENLGSGNFIFVGSSCDMWAKDIHIFWIAPILSRCKEFANYYLFQSKNPSRFNSFIFPPNTTLGTTIESNRDYGLSKAPYPWERFMAMTYLHQKLPAMVSIEPIMDFDLDILVGWIKEIAPEFVSIGADSKGHKLPEPSPDKLKELIAMLETFTQVKLKSNLKRILNERGMANI